MSGCVAMLALIARTVSYLHMHALVAAHGQPGWVAALTLLSVDGEGPEQQPGIGGDHPRNWSSWRVLARRNPSAACGCAGPAWVTVGWRPSAYSAIGTAVAPGAVRTRLMDTTLRAWNPPSAKPGSTDEFRWLSRSARTYAIEPPTGDPP